MNNLELVVDDNFDNDDLVAFQLDSKPINLYYSQLTKYSKHVRDAYLFSDVIKRFPQEIHSFQKEFQLLQDSVAYFFQLLLQNFNIEDNSNITYTQCIDLLKIAKYLEVRKLTYKINEYIKIRNSNDADFVIQMILYEMSMRKDSESSEIEISNDIEQLLASKINECFTNEKFPELQISVIYRAVKKSSKEKSFSNDKLFDFIMKSISKFCVLFQFLDLQKLSDNRLIELCENYSKSDQKEQQHFNYLGCNLNKIMEMIEQLNKSTKKNEEQSGCMKEFETTITSLKNQLNDMQKMNEDQMNKMKELEKKVSELQNKLTDTEKEKEDLNEKLKKELTIKGVVKARVKNGLLISAHIVLIANGVSLDTSRSKCIISKSDSETVGIAAYEKGEPITSLEMETGDFWAKSGTYFVRCLVFDSEGKSKEIVSNAVTTSGNSVAFNYEGEKPFNTNSKSGERKVAIQLGKDVLDVKELKEVHL